MLRHSDSIEELSTPLNPEELAAMEDLDLDKELGLDTPAQKQNQPGKQREMSAEAPEETPAPTPSPSSSSSGGWWSSAWSNAANLVTTATNVATSGNSELSRVVKDATVKATAAVSSINEQYKITEGLVNVAHIVEKKGEDLKNITLQSVDKFLDTIDPIETNLGQVYSASDFEEEGLLAKIKVIASTADPIEIGAVIKTFERIYGEEHVYARGAVVESGLAKQPIGMKNGMRGAQNKINNMLVMDNFKDKMDFIFVAIENFVEEVDGDWYDFHAVILFDRKNNLTIKGFSQGIAIPAEVAEKVRALTPTEYPFREFGASVTVASIMNIANAKVTDSNWYSHRTDGRVDKSLALELAIGAVCGNYWSTMKEIGIVPKN